MAPIERSIFINAPIEKVFDFIAEPNNRLKWDFVDVEIKERSAGPVGIGTTFIEVAKGPGGIRTKGLSRVTEYDRPHNLVIETRSPGMLLTFGHKLEFKEGGTLITLTADCAMPWGFLGRAIDKVFISPLLARNTERIIKDLKAVMESGQAGNTL